MGKRFVCERCGNSDERYIGMINGRPYCRKCISFSGEEASFEPKAEKTVNLSLSYSLSRQQKELSDKVLSNFIEGKDTLIYAVCGSGKTEISFAVLGYAMSKGLRVGFALPRRDVVIELFLRLKEAFPSNRIVAVYGGHTSALEGDCVILTTHQLFRYPNYFDLLVMDEVDAFPFKGSDVLLSMFKRSVKGHFVMMSATPSKQLVSSFENDFTLGITGVDAHGNPTILAYAETNNADLLNQLYEASKKQGGNDLTKLDNGDYMLTDKGLKVYMGMRGKQLIMTNDEALYKNAGKESKPSLLESSFAKEVQGQRFATVINTEAVFALPIVKLATGFLSPKYRAMVTAAENISYLRMSSEGKTGLFVLQLKDRETNALKQIVDQVKTLANL